MYKLNHYLILSNKISILFTFLYCDTFVFCYGFLMQESAHLYLILGTSNSGRREILFDLIQNSSDSNFTQYIILINKNESLNPINQKLQALPNTHLIEWEFNNNQLLIPNFETYPNNKIFLILSSKENLINQIEALKNWLPNHPSLSLARILFTLDCQLAYKNPESLSWFDAIIHFSDYIFLTHREGISEKWINDYIKSSEKDHFPCIFEKIRTYQVHNPDVALNPEARRMSHLFDELDAIDTLEINENELPDEPFDLKIKDDPYLQRDSEGNRVIKLHPPLQN